MKRQETQKENLLRRLEENREFFQATGKMAYASFMEELTGYIKRSEEICPQCGSWSGLKSPREGTKYCEDCGWPDEDFGK